MGGVAHTHIGCLGGPLLFAAHRHVGTLYLPGCRTGSVANFWLITWSPDVWTNQPSLWGFHCLHNDLTWCWEGKGYSDFTTALHRHKPSGFPCLTSYLFLGVWLKFSLKFLSLSKKQGSINCENSKVLKKGDSSFHNSKLEICHVFFGFSTGTFTHCICIYIFLNQSVG